jgi:hypothetical protein
MKMSQVLGTFGLLDFTMLRPVLARRAFKKYESFISLIFKFWGAAVNPGYCTSEYGGTTVYECNNVFLSLPFQVLYEVTDVSLF